MTQPTPEEVVADLMGPLEHHRNCSSKGAVKMPCDCYAANRWKMLAAIREAENRGWNAAVAACLDCASPKTVRASPVETVKVIREAIRALEKQP